MYEEEEMKASEQSPSLNTSHIPPPISDAGTATKNNKSIELADHTLVGLHELKYRLVRNYEVLS
jgi:hypothetical protein